MTNYKGGIPGFSVLMRVVCLRAVALKGKCVERHITSIYGYGIKRNGL